MNIIELLRNLYTNPKTEWISEVEDVDVQPYVIQRWLAMNDALRVQTRWLDKYVFYLSPKMYLSLAWSIIPKTQKMPYIKYIKKVDEEDKFGFILQRVRKHFQLSDNDYAANKSRILAAIKKDMVTWFSFYGIPKKYWKANYINFNQIKEFGINDERHVPQKGLEAFGL